MLAMIRSILQVLTLVVAYSAMADTIQLSSSGIWTTFGDTSGEQKECGVQGEVGDRRLMLFGRSDKPNTMQLTLQNSSWQFPRAPISISFSFGSEITFNFVGTGEQSLIHADIPANQVRNLVHHFTADDEATLTLSTKHESPWRLDLHGTTPTVESMAQCLDTAGIWLPPPFRQEPTVAATVSSRNSLEAAGQPPGDTPQQSPSTQFNAASMPPELVAPASESDDRPASAPEDLSCSDAIRFTYGGRVDLVTRYATKVYMQLDAARVASGKRAIGIPDFKWSNYIQSWMKMCSSGGPFYNVILYDYQLNTLFMP